MIRDQEVVTIEPCPLCSKSHSYTLEVRRSLVLHWGKDPRSAGQTLQRSFHRLFTCPVTGHDFQAEMSIPEREDAVIEKVDVMKPEKRSQQASPSPANAANLTAVSPHNKALYEAGKSLLVDSHATGREFCKSMMSMALGAVPIYIGVLGFITSSQSIHAQVSVSLVLPALLFLLAAVLFAISYFPIAKKFSLDIIEEIEAVRQADLRRRRRITHVALAVFVTGVFLAIAIMATELGR